MSPLILAPPSGRHLEVLCIGAHCDDIEIGCGGTILALQQRYPDCRIHWFVLTSVPMRRAETIASAAALVQPSSRGEVRVCDLKDGLLPAQFGAVKAQFESMKKDLEPDLIFTHHGSDRHQDHSLVNQVTWQTFRDHMIWEYEIPKYDGDLTTPNMYVPIPLDLATQKIDIVMRSFPSPVRQIMVQGGQPSGVDAPAGIGEQSYKRVRGGLPLQKTRLRGVSNAT